MTDDSELREFPPPTPAPPALVTQATALVKRYSECFWFWHPEARVRHLEDVRLVIRNPREYGDRNAWLDAQDLHRCLSPLFKSKWAADSAFRFFPIERDPLLGWRLHLFDVATNKALALSARTETRDYIDIIELHRTYPLAAICWAACGKDPGFTPLSLLKMMRRFARVSPTELDKIKARTLDPKVLKVAWIEISDQAEANMIQLADEKPDMPIGVAFVDASGKPGWIGDDPHLRPQAPSVRGCWPTVHGITP